MAAHVTRLPLEIFDAIALQLTDLEPIGPPDILVPLMQTCRALHGLLVPEYNPGLYSRVFRQKFDVAAVTRRAFRPTPTQCVDQMTQYFAALRVFRRRELRISVAPGEEYPDVGVEDALQIAVVMMLEDDGKNARQLVQWGHADEFVDAFVRCRLYDGAEDNDGWPLENHLNAHALWLMWLLTTEESLLNQTPAQRAQMTQLLLPFVYVPYRYPAALAPPNHFLVPPPITPTFAPSTIPTAHGPYPLYPDPTATSIVHYTSRPQLARPLASAAAKLLFFALEECTPFPIPPHLDRTRADRLARGNHEIGPTREDMEEFNWSWNARLPGGRSWPRRKGPLYDDDDKPFPPRPEGQIFPGFEAPPPIAKWVGKAPHSGEYVTPGGSRGKGKSAKWDVDWMRLRMCGDLMKMPPRVPYGRVYEPFSIEGLWVGRMQIPGEAETQGLINTPMHPPHGLFTEGALGVAPRPFFVRLQELHGVIGEVTPEPEPSTLTPPASSSSHHHHAGAQQPEDTDEDEEEWEDDEGLPVPFALGAEGEHDGMNNAWFAGDRVPRVAPLSSSSTSSDGMERVEVVVGRERAVYRRRQGSEELRGRLGNEAFEGRGRRCDEAAEGSGGEGGTEAEWGGYDHEEGACIRCLQRAEFRRRLGSRSAASPSSSSSEEDEEEGEGEGEGGDGDGLMTPWDGEDAGWVGSGLPPAHEWERRGRGRCDGLGEVVVVGKPDPSHASAFHPFTYHGRIRPWDGLLLLLRTPARAQDAWLGTTLFCGYLVGGDTVVGSWRIGSADPGGPGWGGAFVMGRRED